MRHGMARLVIALSLFVVVAGCATRTRVTASNPAIRLAPTCAAAVVVYDDYTKVPYDYHEVAFIEAEGNAVYNTEGKILQEIREKAAEMGANAIVVNTLEATKATVKLIGAALGSGDADRKGKAIAIHMPADDARVRQVCGPR